MAKKTFEDDFDIDDFDDLKTGLLARDRRKEELSTEGWIYIGVDTLRPGMAKVGLTTGGLGTRASGSQNPFYTLLCAFKVRHDVSREKLHEIESSVIQMLEHHYQRIPHTGSGFQSEWFYVNPNELRQVVHDFLYERHSSYMHCHHCWERDMGVIESWENNVLLGKGSAVPYRASDLSNPPIPFACSMPPGCGEDCDCWD